MIADLVARFDAQRSELERTFSGMSEIGYRELVEIVADRISEPATDTDWTATLDASRMSVIDHGNYQGTLLFVIPERGYQPSAYFVGKMHYGSCSYCDAMQALNDRTARDDDYNKLTFDASQVASLMLFALHFVQSLKEV